MVESSPDLAGPTITVDEPNLFFGQIQCEI